LEDTDPFREGCRAQSAKWVKGLFNFSSALKSDKIYKSFRYLSVQSYNKKMSILRKNSKIRLSGSKNMPDGGKRSVCVPLREA
jgi:hypothetical protein